MKKVLITGSGGLVGFEAANYYLQQGREVVGIDNNMREYFFGEKGSTARNVQKLDWFPKYTHIDRNITSVAEIRGIFQDHEF